MELWNILTEEVKLYENLLDVALNKQKALMERSLEKLNSSIKNESRLTGEIRALEVRRMNSFKDLSETFQLNPEKTKITDVFKAIGANEAERFAKLKIKIVKVSRELDKVNRINALLIEKNMRFIYKSMKAITREIMGKEATYGKSGGLETRTLGRKTFLDKKA